MQSEWEPGAGSVDLQPAQDNSTNMEPTLTGSGFEYFNSFFQKGISSFAPTDMSSIDFQGVEQGPFVKGKRSYPTKTSVSRGGQNSDSCRNNTRKPNQF
jgi:hypothetical protein